MTMTLKHAVSGAAALLGLLGLGSAIWAGTVTPAPIPAPPPTTPPPPGTDPNSSVVISSFVVKNDTCYYAVVYSDGTSASVPVDPRLCDLSYSTGTGSDTIAPSSGGGFTPTVPAPPDMSGALGRAPKIRWF